MRPRSRHERRSRSAGERARHTCMNVSNGESDGSAMELRSFNRLFVVDIGIGIVPRDLRHWHALVIRKSAAVAVCRRQLVRVPDNRKPPAHGTPRGPTGLGPVAARINGAASQPSFSAAKRMTIEAGHLLRSHEDLIEPHRPDHSMPLPSVQSVNLQSVIEGTAVG
jgi:hypothetical protein